MIRDDITETHKLKINNSKKLPSWNFLCRWFSFSVVPRMWTCMSLRPSFGKEAFMKEGLK